MSKNMQSFRLLALLLASLAALHLGSCGSGSSLEPDVHDSFSLRVLPTSLDDGRDLPELSMESRQLAGLATLELRLENATELQAVAVEIAYDASRWQLQDSTETGLLGSSDELLSQSIDVRPGLLAFAVVQIPSRGAEPFSGSGLLASFRFRPGQAGTQRQASALTTQLPQPVWDEGSLTLAWPYANTGDYDQNSEVNIADLTPIGIHFGEAATDPLAATAVIDGDGNGEINIADITPIGVNYGSSLGGYILWELASPLDWMGTADTTPLAEIAFSEASGSPALDRLQFSYAYGADPGFAWLRLAARSGEEIGQPTELFFTYPSLQPLLSVDSPPAAGSGSEADPYFVEVPASFDMHLELQDSTDVSMDALSSFSVLGPAGAGMTGNTLELAADAAGDYLVTAEYDAVPSAPFAVHFHVNEPPDAQLSADPASGHVPFTVLLDASASSDPDGEIVLVEWDFDNDGIFDRETGTELTTLRRYETVGDFEATVRLTDDRGAASISDPLAISVQPPNLSPEPSLEASPLSGNTPLLVSFDATGSIDPDGTIVNIDWDFDKDGEFELLDSGDFEPQFTYEIPGNYGVVIRLVDDDGAVAVSDPLFINVGGNFPPVAELHAIPSAGPSPLQVLLDATESHDPDGSIVLVEWDFGGDGEYDQSGTALSINRTYTGDGEFHPVVRLTDNNGGVTVSEPVTITVGVDAGSAPVAMLQASPDSGPLPLLVTLDASISTDPDGDIVLAEFDIDNDGSFDVQDTDDFIIVQEYAFEGSFAASVRVTDAFGHRSSSLPVTIVVTSGTPPNALFEGNLEIGASPFDLIVDASASSDADGPIASYEWDADGDGVFEYSTTDSQTQLCLLGTGIHTVSLRVVDGDGLTDTYSDEFTVTPPTLSWEDWSTSIVNPVRAIYTTVGGRSAIAWQSSDTQVYYKRASDGTGHSWPVSGTLVDANLDQYPGGSIRLLGFGVAGSLPMLVTGKGLAAAADLDLHVSRGNDSAGNSFQASQLVLSSPAFRVDRDTTGLPLLADFSGLPTICYPSDQSGAWHHIRALDSEGADWPETSQPISGSEAQPVPQGCLLQDPAGGAQLFYYSEDFIQANRDPDGNGSDWNFRQNLYPVEDSVRVQAISSSGAVLLVYTLNPLASSHEVWFSYSQSPSFSSWSSPEQLVSYSSGLADLQLLMDAGKPVLLFSGNPDGNSGVYFMRSHNSLGSHWGEFRRISTESNGELHGAAIVNGRLTAIHERNNGNLRLLSRE